MKKISMHVAVGGTLVIALAGCGGGAINSSSDGAAAGGGNDVLKVGLLVPETGTYAALGKEMRRAADLYLQQHDNTFGGHKVELVVADSAGDPETGKTKAKELALKDKVDVITGLVASPVAVTVADVAEQYKIPMVVANAGANKLTGANASPYVWRVSQSNYQHGYAAGVYAALHVSKTGGVFMGADYSAGTETRDGFIAGYTANGGSTLSAQILTPFGKTQNYQPFLSQIPSGAKFVYAFYAGGEAITFQKNYVEFGFDKKVPLLGAQNLTDQDILPALGDAGLGVTTIGLYAPALDNPASKKFLSAWKSKYNATPSIIAVTTTDAFAFIDKAAQSTKGDVSSDALTKAFPTVGEIDSPRGKFQVDSTTHNPVQDYYARLLVKDGSSFVNKIVATIPAVKG